MDGSKSHWVHKWAKSPKGTSPIYMRCTWPTTPFNEGYLGPFDVQRANIKAEYQTLAITYTIVYREKTFLSILLFLNQFLS